MTGASTIAHCRWLLCCLPLMVACASAACSWQAQENTIADGGTGQSGISDADTCKAACDASCVAVIYYEYDTPRCKTYNSEPQGVVTNPDLYDGSTLYRKICVADTCTMTEMSNTAVTSTAEFSLDLVASEENCRTLCKWVSQCQAITYGSNTCIIHTSAVTSSSAANYVFASKTKCSNGNNCCFGIVETSTMGTSSSANSLVLSTVAETCGEICVSTASCEAVTVSGTTCEIFTVSPVTENRAGSSYFAKSCTGSDTGSLTITSVCSSAATIRLSKLAGVSFQNWSKKTSA